VGKALPIVGEIERALRSLGTSERAAGAKRYLKSDLEFIGVATTPFRAAITGVLRGRPPLDRASLLTAARGLWERPVFELKAAAVELLDRHHRLLVAEDLGPVESMLRQSRTWALVDWLAARVAGPLIEESPELGRDLDRWAEDDELWMRRAALLALLPALRRGGGDFERFGRYADRMLDEREFFIRKAIGWVLREIGKKRPEVVVEWLQPRLGRASGITVREAVKHLPAVARSRIERSFVALSATRRGRQRAANAPSRRR